MLWGYRRQETNAETTGPHMQERDPYPDFNPWPDTPSSWVREARISDTEVSKIAARTTSQGPWSRAPPRRSHLGPETENVPQEGAVQEFLSHLRPSGHADPAVEFVTEHERWGRPDRGNKP